jgi:hypothetical protein
LVTFLSFAASPRTRMGYVVGSMEIGLEFFADNIFLRWVFRGSGPQQTLWAATRLLIVTVHDDSDSRSRVGACKDVGVQVLRGIM